MRILRTEAHKREAGSWDDQPNFIDRDMAPGGLSRMPSDKSKQDIIDSFDPKKRKKKKKRPSKRIYQLGIDVPITEKEELNEVVNK